MKGLLSAIFFILSSYGLFAQDFDRKKMDALFDQIDEKEKGMASVSLCKNKEELYSRSIGYIDLEKDQKANTDTKYRIGSISKSFTAVIILQLMEEGKLSLQTPLSTFFPKYTNADSITIELMLLHRSGLYNFTNSPGYTKWSQEAKSRQELIDYMRTMGVVFPPNSKFQYSNTNYVLLSIIAEKLDNKSYDQILEDRIVKPLKLQNTYYGGKMRPAKNEALSYTRLGIWNLADETDLSVPLGAGGILSTPKDLNTFFFHLFNGDLLSDSSLERMMDTTGGFGMGLFAAPFQEKTGYGHTGGIDGYQSQSIAFLEESLYLSITGNGYDMLRNDIVVGMLKIYYGEEYEIPDFKPEYQVSVSRMQKYLGKYTCNDIGLDLTITLVNHQLIGQATDQPAFPLYAYEKDKFKYEIAGVKIEFYPNEDKLVLLQGKGYYKFYRQEE